MTEPRDGQAYRFVRIAVGTLCVGTIAGMIACAVTHHLGGVLTLGCITVGAILVLMASTAVANERATTGSSGATFDDRQAHDVELLVTNLVDKGAPEVDLRELVGAAVRLGRDART